MHVIYNRYACGPVIEATTDYAGKLSFLPPLTSISKEGGMSPVSIREWSVYSNQSGGNSYHIWGETLPAAIAQHMGRIAADANLGNAAGYCLVKARLESGPANATVAGKPFALLLLTHRGRDLAHRPAEPTPTTTQVRIAATPEDIPEGGYEFPLRGEQA